MLFANRQTALQPEGRMRPVVVIASEKNSRFNGSREGLHFWSSGTLLWDRCTQLVTYSPVCTDYSTSSAYMVMLPPGSERRNYYNCKSKPRVKYHSRYGIEVRCTAGPGAAPGTSCLLRSVGHRPGQAERVPAMLSGAESRPRSPDRADRKSVV